MLQYGRNSVSCVNHLYACRVIASQMVEPTSSDIEAAQESTSEGLTCFP